MKNYRIIYTLIPKSYLIGLIIGILLRLPGGEYIILSNIILNITSLLIFSKIGVIIHEIGHLLFAKMVNGKPRRLILGNGHEVSRFILFNIKVVINTPFRSGYAFSSFDDLKFIKWRYLFYISGGFLSNLIFVLIIYRLYGFNIDAISGEYGIDLASAFIFSNSMLIITTLIPYRISYMGIKMPNDGLNIITLPFRNIEKLNERINTNDLLDAYEYFELKEYDKAIQIYENYQKIDNSQLIVKINLSVMYMKKGEYLRSLEYLNSVIELLNDKKNKAYKALVHNNLAWLYMILKDYDKADSFSKIAIDLVPREKNFQGTRGSALIEKGEVEQGINMLLTLVDFNFPNSQTLAAAMYLCLGYSKLDKKKEITKYLDFVQTNIDKLDIDEVKIWKSIKDRIG
jgi:tetratricopeptide (TPR) repeat protein